MLFLPLMLAGAVLFVQRVKFSKILDTDLLLLLTIGISAATWQLSYVKDFGFYYDKLTDYVPLVLVLAATYIGHRLSVKVFDDSYNTIFLYVTKQVIFIALTLKIAGGFEEALSYEANLVDGSIFALAPVVFLSIAIASVISALAILRTSPLQKWTRFVSFIGAFLVISFAISFLVNVLNNKFLYYYVFDISAIDTAISFTTLAIIGYLIVDNYVDEVEKESTLICLFVVAGVLVFDFESLILGSSIGRTIGQLIALILILAVPALYIYIAWLTSLAAERKGRNRRSWFWLCLLSPVISWFAIASMLPPRETIDLRK